MAPGHLEQFGESVVLEGTNCDDYIAGGIFHVQPEGVLSGDSARAPTSWEACRGGRRAWRRARSGEAARRCRGCGCRPCVCGRLWVWPDGWPPEQLRSDGRGKHAGLTARTARRLAPPRRAFAFYAPLCTTSGEMKRDSSSKHLRWRRVPRRFAPRSRKGIRMHKAQMTEARGARGAACCAPTKRYKMAT